jgi:hypothetical protein
MARLFEKARRWHTPCTEQYGRVLVLQVKVPHHFKQVQTLNLVPRSHSASTKLLPLQCLPLGRPTLLLRIFLLSKLDLALPDRFIPWILGWLV